MNPPPASSPALGQSPGAPVAVKLRLAQVTKTFENTGNAGQTVEALKPISLEIQAGECVVLFGPSGCGKSTLLNLIAGFEAPTSGEITLEDQPVTGPGNDRLMMFQEHALFPWLKVIDNVIYGLKWEPPYRFRRRRQRQKALELLTLVHLEEFVQSSIHELSGGMRHRVALARALAPDPKVLLIDEPFPALDALVRAKLYLELQDILVRTRKIIVSVTHDPREAACLGDRVIVLTGRPGTIKAEIIVDLPRPRGIEDPEVAEYARKINAELEEEKRGPGIGQKV
jgi:NitT/TauT family transport system ATP-binding protein